MNLLIYVAERQHSYGQFVFVLHLCYTTVATHSDLLHLDCYYFTSLPHALPWFRHPYILYWSGLEITRHFCAVSYDYDAKVVIDGKFNQSEHEMFA